MAKPTQSDINGVYSPFSPYDHIPPSMDPCAFETLLSPIKFVFSRYLFVSTALFLQSVCYPTTRKSMDTRCVLTGVKTQTLLFVSLG